MGEEMFEFIALMSFGLNWDALKTRFIAGEQALAADTPKERVLNSGGNS
jgi:hypothetical protein